MRGASNRRCRDQRPLCTFRSGAEVLASRSNRSRMSNLIVYASASAMVNPPAHRGSGLQLGNELLWVRRGVFQVLVGVRANAERFNRVTVAVLIESVADEEHVEEMPVNSASRFTPYVWSMPCRVISTDVERRERTSRSGTPPCMAPPLLVRLWRRRVECCR